MGEVIPKAGVSSLSDKVNEVHKWSNDNKFQLNLGKCKELRIKANVYASDLKWNKHIQYIVEKASKY
jgi:hypothetical protein